MESALDRTRNRIRNGRRNQGEKRRAKRMSAEVAAVLFAALAGAILSGGCATFVIRTPNLASIPDGTYRGSFEDFPVAATVDVFMAARRIDSVEIVEHQTMKGAPAEAIVDEVVRLQSLEVDAVSGATLSSRVILKAIEVALTR